MAAKRSQEKQNAGRVKKPWPAFSVVLIAVMVSALGVVYSTHKSRHLLNELKQLENQRNEMQVVWGQLLLEQSSLISQGRIEDIAIAELGMEIPVMDSIVVVQK